MADVGNVEFGAFYRPPIALQKATLLSERNLMIDELMQVKKEMNVAQSEMKRMAEAMAQRLGQFEGRLQAGEANVRTLDKREGSNAILTTKLRQEADLRSKEMGSEMGRLRRQVEETLRGHVEGLRGEFRQREQQMLRLEAATRQHAQAVASATEGRARWEGELTNRIDRRFEAGSQAQLNLERQAQERTERFDRQLEAEAAERARGDRGVRADLDDAVLALRGAVEGEGQARAGLHSAVRGELDELAMAVRAELRAVREEAERGRAKLAEALQDERAARVEEQGAVARRLEAFVRLFTAERERQQEAVAHALQQMGERTRELTALARQIQQEGVTVRVTAAKVHEEASMGLRTLEDRLEEATALLFAGQDRHAALIQEHRSAAIAGMQDVRDKVALQQQRVTAELDKNFKEDRETRASFDRRVQDVEDAAARQHKELASQLARLGDVAGKSARDLERELDRLRFRAETELGDLRGEVRASERDRER